MAILGILGRFGAKVGAKVGARFAGRTAAKTGGKTLGRIGFKGGLVVGGGAFVGLSQLFKGGGGGAFDFLNPFGEGGIFPFLIVAAVVLVFFTMFRR